jgi:hypothetical protein
MRVGIAAGESSGERCDRRHLIAEQLLLRIAFVWLSRTWHHVSAWECHLSMTQILNISRLVWGSVGV